MEQYRIGESMDDVNAKGAYNVLRTRALQRIRSHNWQSILVTSAGPNEGKTLTATNLAISLARDVNQSTVLVDLDLTRSSVAKYLGINLDIKAGVGDYLLGKAKFDEIVYCPDGLDRLAIVPNCEPVPNSSDLLGSPKMKAFVSRIAKLSEQSIVIYDMPPVLACDDVLAFCPSVDAVLVVVAQGRTGRTALEKTMRMLSEFEILGVVLNLSDELSGENAYGYY
jgi:capsular exopolysaccharide synthesis family protein